MKDRRVLLAMALVFGLGLFAQAGSTAPSGDKVILNFKEELTDEKLKDVQEALKSIEALESCDVKASEVTLTLKDKKFLKLSEVEIAIKKTKVAINASKISLTGKLELFFKVGANG